MMDTNISFLNKVEKLEQIFTIILHSRNDEQLISPSSSQLGEIRDALNDLFRDYGSTIACTDVLYTLNTDCEFFGCMVNPLYNYSDVLLILTGDTPVNASKYQLELDSKIWDIGLDADELTAMVLYEISALMLNPDLANHIRNLISLEVLSSDDAVRIRDSVNYSQLLLYAIKDTAWKITSLMFKEDVEEMLSNPVIVTAELQDALESGQEKLVNNVYGLSDSVRSPKTIVLKWYFMVYQDIQHNSRLARETLKDAKDFTASVLQKQEIDKTVTALDRIDATTLIENVALPRLLEKKALHSVCEGSIFKSLKQSGLKSIENDFYELSIKAKAMECEDDALFIIRAINTRLGILEDYIYNTELSDSESKKWNAVADNYRSLREFVVKSKVFKKKSYGLFFDYNQLDQIDESFAMEPVRESIFTKYVKIPQEDRTTPEDIYDAATFKKKIDASMKYLEDNKVPEKQLSSNVKAHYYAVIGTFFGQGVSSSHHYTDQISYLLSKHGKYLIAKHKSQIAKDIQTTIKSFNKLIEQNKPMTQLQKEFFKDIQKAARYV